MKKIAAGGRIRHVVTLIDKRTGVAPNPAPDTVKITIYKPRSTAIYLNAADLTNTGGGKWELVQQSDVADPVGVYTGFVDIRTSTALDRMEYGSLFQLVR